jgi:hypothetical protein
MNAEKRLAIAAHEASHFFSLKRSHPRTYGDSHPPGGTRHHISDETARTLHLEFLKALNGYEQALLDGEL